MESRKASDGWSVFDGSKFLQPKPEDLMSEIDAAITAIEYARATALLNLSPSTCPSSSKNNSPDRNTASVYDACISEEACRMGCVTKAEGMNLDSTSPDDLHACS